MKYPILCAFLVVVFTASAFQPFASLDAAEIWNSQRNSGTARTKSYYNPSGKASNRDSNRTSSATLYNSRNSRTPDKVKYGRGLDSAVQAYKAVKMSGQRESKQWKFLSSSAKKNRQSDIDRALQIEYKTRKNTAKTMIKVFKEDEIARQKNKKRQEADRAAREAAKEEKALERQHKKDVALGRAEKGSTRRAAKGSYTASGSKKIRRVRKSSSSSTGLKKPKRLYNDPNE